MVKRSNYHSLSRNKTLKILETLHYNFSLGIEINGSQFFNPIEYLDVLTESRKLFIGYNQIRSRDQTECFVTIGFSKTFN